jgi:hypothetical protein
MTISPAGSKVPIERAHLKELYSARQAAHAALAQATGS